MPRYLLAFHGGGMPETPEEQESIMAAWGAWYGSLGESVLDGGAPTGAAATIATEGAVTPGGGSNPVSGYALISAETLDDAVVKSMTCPVRDSGGSIEVCEIVEMG